MFEPGFETSGTTSREQVNYIFEVMAFYSIYEPKVQYTVFCVLALWQRSGQEESAGCPGQSRGPGARSRVFMAGFQRSVKSVAAARSVSTIVADMCVGTAAAKVLKLPNSGRSGSTDSAAMSLPNIPPPQLAALPRFVPAQSHPDELPRLH
jgi:hypothetical protein